MHTEFVDKINGIADRFSEGKLVLSMEITNFLKKWLTDHIMGVDKAYSVLFQKEPTT